MNVLVKYPTRSRPDLFRAVLELYLRDPIVRVLVTADIDDPSMFNDEMIAWLAQQPRVIVRWGNCKSKVEACNDGLAEEDWSLVILASDDMVPQYDDYASRIVGLFEQFFPDGDGVLHLNDGRVGKQLNTICVCGRSYFDRFGYLYHPEYKATHCDNEWQEVSERLGRAVYVPECVIQHRWIGEHAPDFLHRHNESFSPQDGRLYETRQRAGFPR